MDAYIKQIATLKNPSSILAFGEWSLQNPDDTDEIHSEIFFGRPSVSQVQKSLIEKSYTEILNSKPEKLLALHAGTGTYIPKGLSKNVTSLNFKSCDDYEDQRMSTAIAHDLNENPTLPFKDEDFDAAILTVDIGILSQPLEVFREVARVLAPGSTFVVTFIHPFFSKSMTRMWASGFDQDHIVLADSYFEYSNGFTKVQGRTLFKSEDGIDWYDIPMPYDGNTYDYVFAFWAHKGHVPENLQSSPPFPPLTKVPPKTRDDVKFDHNHNALCPHCESTMEKIAPPVTVFEIDYGVSELEVCFNNSCPYHIRSKPWMRAQGRPGFMYRFMRNPETGSIGPIPDDLFGNLATSKIA